MVQLQYNPFSIHTASTIWSDRNSSFPVRATKATAGLVYDSLVKNPYELSIGNAKKLILHRKELSKKEMAVGIAATFLTSCMACVIVGTTLHISGRALQVAGSSIALKAAKGLQLVGRKIFVTGGVPLYGLFYAAPKQILKHIPEACRFLANKVVATFRYAIKHFLLPVWKHVMYPMLKQLGRAFERILQKTFQVVEFLFKNVLIPLWNKVIFPILKACRYVITKSYMALKFCLTGLWNRILVPLINSVIKPCFRLLEKSFRYLEKIGLQSLEFLAKKTMQAIRWTFNTFVVPFCKKVLAPALRMLGTSLSYLLTKTTQAANWLFRTVLAPLWNNAVRPLGMWIAKELGAGLQKISPVYNSVIKPIVAMIHERLEFTSHAFRAIRHEVVEFTSHAFRAIRHEVVETWSSLSLRLTTLIRT